MLSVNPAPVLHDTELSDAHSVPSHPVHPVTTPALYDPAPTLDPLTVTLPCPVDPWFPSPVPDPDPTSYEPPPVNVLDRSPAVTYVVRLPAAPDPPLHCLLYTSPSPRD